MSTMHEFDPNYPRPDDTGCNTRGRVAIKDGGPAFPVLKTSPLGMYVDQNGMTLRDYFAAKAMQAICSTNPTTDWTDARIAQDAYRLADAMLVARETQP